ncbi:MAG: lipoyl synthase [Clostridia bacterium]|nr:lipoyl synthase [Clostridia bacterium]
MDQSTSNQPIRQRKPEWLRAPSGSADALHDMRRLLRGLHLNTVCEEAACPNCGECFSRQTATFLIMGPVCSRHCRFCQVSEGDPLPLDPQEPEHVAEAVRRLGLRHVVITSVTRDDLLDGGAAHFAAVIRTIKSAAVGAGSKSGQPAMAVPVIEVLIPDFQGDLSALKTIIAAQPDIINHNIETVRRLYDRVRPEADYDRSLELIGRIRRLAPEIVSKSGLMVGLGETHEEVLQVMADLRGQACDILTIGQYLAPSRQHLPVADYIHPDQFDRWKSAGLAMGFKSIAAGPLVRSSYMAEQVSAGLLSRHT